MKKVIISIFAALMALPALAWGPEGHRIIAEVAYHYMTKKAVKQVDKVLGTHGAVYWATWADEIRSDTIYPTSFDWHFQDLEAGMTDSEVAAVLTDYPKEGGNLYRALDSLYALLQKDRNSRDALRFLVHLSGDRYCPMHHGHIADKGGNIIKLKWFGTPTNLHRVWDEDLIRFRGYSVTEYAQLLMDMYGSERQAIEQAAPEELLVRTYHVTDDIYKHIETWNGNVYHYVYRWKEPMERQLYTAGVRLAMVLNELYK
jgi:hypothetical protein